MNYVYAGHQVPIFPIFGLRPISSFFFQEISTFLYSVRVLLVHGNILKYLKLNHTRN